MRAAIPRGRANECDRSRPRALGYPPKPWLGGRLRGDLRLRFGRLADRHTINAFGPACSDIRVKPSFLRTTPAKKPRTECCCQPVAFMMAAIVVPLGCLSRARMASCLVSRRVEAAGMFPGFAALFAPLLARANLVFVGVLLSDICGSFSVATAPGAVTAEAPQWHHRRYCRGAHARKARRPRRQIIASPRSSLSLNVSERIAMTLCASSAKGRCRTCFWNLASRAAFHFHTISFAYGDHSPMEVLNGHAT